jgi:RNA polymerase sigma factor (sigma-70 family)
MVITETPGESAPEKVEAANHLLDQLSPAQRDVVVLCIMQGVSHNNAAELLGISVNAVDQRLSRARRIMQRASDDAAKILGIT